MYHCHMRFYFVGRRREMFEIIRQIPPLECFTHEFLEIGGPSQVLAQKADVIFADLREMDAAATVQQLLQEKKQEAELIVLAEREQIPLLAENFPALSDIWACPMRR